MKSKLDNHQAGKNVASPCFPKYLLARQPGHTWSHGLDDIQNVVNHLTAIWQIRIGLPPTRKPAIQERPLLNPASLGRSDAVTCANVHLVLQIIAATVRAMHALVQLCGSIVVPIAHGASSTHHRTRRDASVLAP